MLLKKLRTLQLFCLALHLLSSMVGAEQIPYCNGQNRSTKEGVGIALHAEDSGPALCAPGTALVFHQTLLHGHKPANIRTVAGNCCPMLEGSLSDEHGYYESACPENMVVTGARFKPATFAATKERIVELRCTKIDTESFSLVTSEKVLNFEFANPDLGNLFRSLFKPESRTGRNMLPYALRSGAPRASEFTEHASGCVGYPWGSAMTAIGTSECIGFSFAEIVRK
jgi:hypothetical protein